MKYYLIVFLSSILAGACIGLGATAYLLTYETNKYLGMFLFGLGLFTIIQFSLHLYTGRVGNLLNNKPKYLIELLICFIGNVLGVLILTGLVRLTRTFPQIEEIAKNIVSQKQSDTPYSIFILSTLCGMMIYLAVKGHEIAPYPLAKVIFAFLPIVLFILGGFEHCVANVAYYVYAGTFSLNTIGYFLLMILGNGLGAVLFDGILKLINYLKENRTKYIN